MRRVSEPAAHAVEGRDIGPVPPVAVQYVDQFFQKMQKEGVRPEAERELRMLAALLDLLVQGTPPGLGDLVMQRLESVESEVSCRQRGLATHLGQTRLRGARWGEWRLHIRMRKDSGL